MMSPRGFGLRKVHAEIGRVERLNGVAAAGSFELVEEFPGLTKAQLRTPRRERQEIISAAVSKLNAGEDQRAIADALLRFNCAEEARAARRSEGDPIKESDELKIRDFLIPATNEELLVRIPLYQLPSGSLTSHVQHFSGGTVPEPHDHMHYISDEGAKYISRRDGSSLGGIRTRTDEDIRKDHNYASPQFAHTLGLNDCVVRLLKEDFNVSGGYRGRLYFRGDQVVPDARVSAYLDHGGNPAEFLGGSWPSPISKEARNHVRQQLSRHVPAARRPGGITVICVCENYELMQVAREQAANISIVELLDFSVLPLPARRLANAHLPIGQPQSGRLPHLFFSFFLEYERSATTRRAIRRKLKVYFDAVLEGHDVAAIFICERRGAANLFREVHRDMQKELQVSFPLITSTHAEVSAGRFDSCWRMDGKTVRLLS